MILLNIVFSFLNYILRIITNSYNLLTVQSNNSIVRKISPCVVSFYDDPVDDSICTGYIHSVVNGNLVIVTVFHGIVDNPTNQDGEYSLKTELNIFVRDAYLKNSKNPQNVQERVVVLGSSIIDDISICVTVSGHFDEYRQSKLSFSNSEARKGNSLIIVGVPGGVIEPDCSFGEIREGSFFPEIKNTSWYQEAPSLMGTAPVSNGSSGSPMCDNNGDVWSIVQWRVKDESAFVGGIFPRFFREIINRIIELNRSNLINPSLTTKAIDFNGSTGKGTLGVSSADLLVGSTLIRFRRDYEEYFVDSIYNKPEGYVVLESIEVSDDNGYPAGVEAANIVKDDIIFEIGSCCDEPELTSGLFCS